MPNNKNIEKLKKILLDRKKTELDIMSHFNSGNLRLITHSKIINLIDEIMQTIEELEEKETPDLGTVICWNDGRKFTVQECMENKHWEATDACSLCGKSEETTPLISREAKPCQN